MTDENKIGEKKPFNEENKTQVTGYSDEDFVKERINESRQYQGEEYADESSEEHEEDKRLIKPADFNPSNSIEVAHLLMSSSKLTSFMPELDKEIKLAKLNKEEKAAIYTFQSVWDDILWLRANQKKQKTEFQMIYGSDFDEEDQLLQEVERRCEGYLPEEFDSLSTLRKSERIATLSRGTGGFERIQQVSTITTNKNENYDESERKPGFISRISGGFK